MQPKPGTLYSYALANKIAGAYLGTANAAQINANFNSNLGNAGCLDGTFFYLGLDSNHGANIDFVVTLLHEMGHGIGFQTFTNGSTGAQNGGYLAIWDHFLYGSTAGKLWKDMTNAERQASALSIDKLAWTGAGVTIPSVRITQADGVALLGQLAKRTRTSSGVVGAFNLVGSQYSGADPLGRMMMFAPNPYQSGSSVSHFDTSAFRNQLMEPAISGDLTQSVLLPQDLTFKLLQDIGWKVPTNAGRAGMLGLPGSKRQGVLSTLPFFHCRLLPPMLLVEFPRRRFHLGEYPCDSKH
ncbi:protease-associated domain-containing protein [Roseateles oligotrophus]|uniref:Uncharacterized protein n=1 Tax=Roseateles oligotrophus TaxID=1769250 RepID=A0ABT2YKF9_9BURK|nr:hypothetical protein [Roseateles oligotrophus]MCV2370550.1 hypothetical protein [Roseateles oligotrophus]